jgi:hypothetical protein
MAKQSKPVPPGRRARLEVVVWLALALAGFCFLPRVSGSARLLGAFVAASASLLIFYFVVRRRVRRQGRVLTYQFVPRSVHYIQLTMHSCIYAYWGWYWREVYSFVPLLIAQVVFIYAIDMLVCWSRRDEWVLGFGPFPIILSTNLFLWFRDDWFFLQFLLIATAVLGREFVKWKRDGRLTHIFNPSAFALCLFSIGLLATKSTAITYGIEIATTIHRPEHIYLEIFFLGLIVQSLFQVTLVTLWAALALYVLNLVYTRITGDYQFIDSNIPVAVFLGLHLLVTDPATSPRRGLGKIIFGALYGVAVFGLYTALKAINGPEFYDKLLCVPPLNLSVRLLDRVSEAAAAKSRAWISKIPFTAFLSNLRPRQANFAWMGVWVCLFVTMSASGFLKKDQDHPGGHAAYWANLCQQGRSRACETWVSMLRAGCAADSRTDCLALGKAVQEGPPAVRDPGAAGVSFGHACDLGAPEGCSQLLSFVKNGGKAIFMQACDRGDGASCFILGSLFSSGQGLPQDPAMALQLFQNSCNSGWSRGCGRLGVSYLFGQGTPIDRHAAIENFEKGCRGRNGASCLEAAQYYRNSGSMELEQERLRQACDLGLRNACGEQGAPHPIPVRYP